MSNNKVKLGLYITGREYMKTFRVIRDMVEKLLPNGEIKVTTPDMQDLERTVAGLKEELEVFRNREYGFENELELKQTIATQKRVIEKLKTYVQHRVDCICRAGVLQYSEECDCGLIEAMNKLEDLKKL